MMTTLRRMASAVLGNAAVQAFVRVWLLFAGMTAVLYYANPHSPARTALPASTKLSFFCGEIILTSLVLAAVVILVFVAGRIARRAGTILAIVLYTGVAAYLVVSWGHAFQTSYFMGSGSLQMLATNPIALAKHSLHFHMAATLTAPFAAAGLATATWLTVSTRRRQSRAVHRVAAGALLALLAVAYFESIPWSMLPFRFLVAFNSPETGQVSTLGDYLNELYLRKNGPLTTLAAEHLVARDATLFPDESIPVQWKPQLALDDYLRGVDGAALKKFNVLLILVESLRSDELKSGGSTLDVMPNLNRLAEESWVFADNFATASHSNYADLAPLSSHYPLRSADTHTYPKNPTYPRVLIYDILKRLGYHTAVISSQNESWGNMINYLSTDGLDDLLHSDNFDGDTYVPANDIGFFSMAKRSGKVDDRYTVDRAIGWIDAHRGAPFFIYSNLQNSHFPFEVGPGFHRRFGPERIDFEPQFNSLAPGMIDVMRARYRDSLAYIDDQLGRLFDHLKRAGLWDNTIVVVSGDTGQAFMEHGFSGHANQLYNELLKTSLLIRIPGAGGGVSHRLVQHIDVAPTVLGAIGLPKHPSFQGVDLFREPVDEHREIFLVVQSPFSEQYAVVRDGVKYIFEPFSNRSFLYDLQADPGETRNVVARNEQIARWLRRRLDTWRDLQIRYYGNPNTHMVYYPPVMQTEPASSGAGLADTVPGP